VSVFKDYDQAHAFAWARAKGTGLDQGVEKLGQYSAPYRFKVTFLPTPERCFGYEANIERVVSELVPGCTCLADLARLAEIDRPMACCVTCLDLAMDRQAAKLDAQEGLTL
jgi:hypothetical protein